MMTKNLNLNDIFKLFHPTLKHTYSFQGHIYYLPQLTMTLRHIANSKIHRFISLYVHIEIKLKGRDKKYLKISKYLFIKQYTSKKPMNQRRNH